MNTLKEQDGRYYQEAEVVMLATNEKSTNAVISVRSDKPWAMMSEKHSPFAIKKYDSPELYHTYSNLYFLSDDEPKVNDWCLEGLTPLAPTQLTQVTKEDLERCIENYYYGSCKKIISSTDESLGLPKPSDSFISKYIEEYNKGNTITNIWVEYEDQGYYDAIDEDKTWVENWQLKVDSNNTITIKKIKDSYSRK